MNAVATSVEQEQFESLGYFVRPGFFGPERVDRICAAVDAFVAVEAPFDGRNVWRHPILSELAVDEATLAIVDCLMGTKDYAWHHVHAARHPG